jgi:purine-nucleoside phosphorylase
MSQHAASALDSTLGQAAEFLTKRLGADLPKLAVVAGSGLGGFTRLLQVQHEIPYGEIPGFPVSTVVGHAGKLLLASYKGRPMLVLSGRSHLYEGHEPERAVFGVRLMARLGARVLILSNAAGGVHKNLAPGDLMLIRDHINMMFKNPLIGPNDDKVGPRFPDMSQPYDRELGRLALEVAREEGITLREGTYLAGQGPTYETQAEVRALVFLGADAVGMSTAPETIAAVHAGLRVLGISLISNSHVLGHAPVTTHEEVMEVARMVEERFARLVGGIVGRVKA